MTYLHLWHLMPNVSCHWKGHRKVGNPFCHIFISVARTFKFIFLIFTWSAYAAGCRDTVEAEWPTFCHFVNVFHAFFIFILLFQVFCCLFLLEQQTRTSSSLVFNCLAAAIPILQPHVARTIKASFRAISQESCSFQDLLLLLLLLLLAPTFLFPFPFPWRLRIFRGTVMWTDCGCCTGFCNEKLRQLVVRIRHDLNPFPKLPALF